ARFAQPLVHVDAYGMAQEHGRAKNEGREEGMQSLQPLEDALAPLITELVARNGGNEEPANNERQGERPHEGVSISAARDRSIDDVSGAEPGQGDDDARPERPEVLTEARRDWRRPGCRLFTRLA